MPQRAAGVQIDQLQPDVDAENGRQGYSNHLEPNTPQHFICPGSECCLTTGSMIAWAKIAVNPFSKLRIVMPVTGRAAERSAGTTKAGAHCVGHTDPPTRRAEAREDNSQDEQVADALACEWLVPQKELDAFVARTKPYFSQAAIRKFAHSVGVHPGIVVGRLQHLGAVPYSHSRGMLVKIRAALLEQIAH